MKIALITGAGGLIGSEACRYFSNKGLKVIGIDNDMRQYFFGVGASTAGNIKKLQEKVNGYEHYAVDIRDIALVENIFKKYSSAIDLVVHAAAQPSHDWAAKEPQIDFSINANGTLNLLELTRKYCANAVFIFNSTNKVYGDLPNQLPFEELSRRWELPTNHRFFNGINESMGIDQSKHSLYGASKLAADILVQEYGKYFGLKTVSFRSGCLTGPYQSGAQLHGFLSYLVKCCVSGEPYTIFGYKGKQVRDNLHSYDMITAFDSFYQNPKNGEVYNIGGGRENSCSVLEAIDLSEKVSGKKFSWKLDNAARSGDHQWYISDMTKFKSHYPQWKQQYSLEEIIEEIVHNIKG